MEGLVIIPGFVETFLVYGIVILGLTIYFWPDKEAENEIN